MNTETGRQQTFVAQRTNDPAVYVADVVFPAAGTWRYEVFDDFTSWGGEPAPCAQTHTFAAVDVGGPAGGGSQTPPSSAEPAPAQPFRPRRPGTTEASPFGPSWARCSQGWPPSQRRCSCSTGAADARRWWRTRPTRGSGA